MSKLRCIGVNVPLDLFAQFQEASNQAGSPTIGGWLRDLGKRELNAPTPKRLSWGDLDAAERGAEWSKYKSNGVILPPEFSSWPAVERTKYLDKTFPLEGK